MTHTTAPMQAQHTRGGRGRRGRQDTKAKPQHQATRPLPSPERTAVAQGQANANSPPDAPQDTETAVCWICAEPVKYYSISDCDHRTCHVCALRLRALYRKMECAFCKVRGVRSFLEDGSQVELLQAPQVSVIFTSSPDALFASFTPDRIPYKDQKLSVCFETKEMMEETLILLRYNCPDPTCDYNASGWHDLKLHVRAIHHKSMWLVVRSLLCMSRMTSPHVVICVFGQNASFLMNTYSTLLISSRCTFRHCVRSDHTSPCSRSRSRAASIHYVNSAMSHSLTTTSSSPICERNTRNASCVSATI
jgi:hypothetical protein